MALTVCLCCWNVDVNNLTNGHIFDSLIKTRDHLTSHAGKCQWLVAITGGVKLSSVIKSAYVVDFYLFTFVAHETPIVKNISLAFYPRVTQINL
nr:MAG TPA: hypothetical protein [Caudoviricetes sp.]